jgi:NADPH:quinone reductase-like Zn-dependent oxidoreductase
LESTVRNTATLTEAQYCYTESPFSDFNFGIPELPYVSGRELVGEVAISPRRNSRFKPGDLVIVVSTDYRDIRKAAYQQCVVANDFNVCRLPPNVSQESGSALGVAFVAATICLGICVGLDFSTLADGPNLLSIVRQVDPDRLPDDIRLECLNGIDSTEQAIRGDWLAIWGGSSTSAFMMNQIARLLGLRTISVVDCRKHALSLSSDPKTRPDILVDSHDPNRAVEIVRSVTNNKLRFAVDTVGRDTATHLMQCLQHTTSSELESISTTDATRQSAHLVGLTGLPKVKASSDITFHTMPIKVFHEIAEVGDPLMLWLERLLSEGLLVPPPVLGVREGFEAINGALDSMRRGEVSGGRVVVKV